MLRSPRRGRAASSGCRRGSPRGSPSGPACSSGTRGWAVCISAFTPGRSAAAADRRGSDLELVALARRLEPDRRAAARIERLAAARDQLVDVVIAVVLVVV